MLAIVTGATGGLGYATAFGLARAGHRVILTGRDPAKGAAALDSIRRTAPGAHAEFALLDVASLASIAAFAGQAGSFGPVDVLVNNAGIMGLPTRRTTADGFEAQLGTNFLGHFALTGHLLPLLLAASSPRVVSVSSLAHRRAAIAFDDLQSQRRYSPMRAYGQSKLAMLMFARDLQRRATRAGWPLLSVAAHPGWTATRIVLNGMGQGALHQVLQAGFSALGQSAENGARPILFAALAPGVEPGGYYGPAGFGELHGPAAPARVMPQAQDPAACARLWDAAESATGVRFGD